MHILSNRRLFSLKGLFSVTSCIHGWLGAWDLDLLSGYGKILLRRVERIEIKIMTLIGIRIIALVQFCFDIKLTIAPTTSFSKASTSMREGRLT